ncbi:MAG: NAD-dependent epimerase/dehydratase family protein [Ignavibacteriaceae bacterium]|nr:NAD-dependent epimerase/dehydratase family protein [Ignavibacteriaceae bacterium]
MDKNLIVGFTGGIGWATAKALREKGQKVKLFIRDEAKAAKYLDGFEEYELFQGDASNSADIKKALHDCDRLFYCVNVPYTEWAAKAIPLFRVSADASIEQRKKFIFPGNVYVYGKPQFNPVTEGHPHHPLTRKGRIREEMEQYLGRAFRSGRLDYTTVRMPDFYGPFVINGFTEQLFISALRGKKLVWYGSPTIEQEYIFIEDAGKAMAVAGLSDKTAGMSFNIPGYSSITAKEMLKLISRLGGKNSGISISNSLFLTKIAGIFNRMAGEFAEMMYLKQEKLLLSGELYRNIFGDLPAVDYEAGVTKTLKWAKQFYKI